MAVRQACAEAVGTEARVLRRTGVLHMLFLVYLEALKASTPLTLEADKMLDAVQRSYGERVRRMTTVPVRKSAVLQASGRRLDMLRGLLSALMETDPDEACEVLKRSWLGHGRSRKADTSEEFLGVFVSYLCDLLQAQIALETTYGQEGV